MKENFKDWCENNNHKDLLNRWNTTKNEFPVEGVSCTSQEKFYFKCPDYLSHKDILVSPSLIYYGKTNMKCVECNSFEHWCMQSNVNGLRYWDFDKNDVLPSEVFYSSAKKYWFKCDNPNHPSRLIKLNSIVGYDYKFKCKHCSSIAQFLTDSYGENGIRDYWGSQNLKSPWDVSAGTTSKYYIKCAKDVRHGEYLVSIGSFASGCRCPYCVGLRAIPEESFAQYHISNTDEDFLMKYWDYNENKYGPWELSVWSTKPIYIFCQEKDYHGSYKTSPSAFSSGRRCKFCAKVNLHPRDSLGAVYVESLPLWSSKNKDTPFVYTPKDHRDVWWKCDNNKHEDYQRSVFNASRSGFRCTKCVRERTESFLQEKVRTYISNGLGYNLLHEAECTIIPKNPINDYNLPFDNEVVDLKLIVEVNGQQHYHDNVYRNFWRRNKSITPQQALEYQQYRDSYKRSFAIANGYFYLEIPYWSDNKSETYKKMIDGKIAEILKLKETV